MSREEEEENRGFTVIDRRGESEEAEPEAPAGPSQADREAAAREASRGRSHIPKIDFATFLLSLGTSALYHMGQAADPASGESAPEKNLPLARQTIDTIEMLEAKTRGNLDPEEARLLESLLYELRMRFVESSGKPGESSGKPGEGG